MEPLPPSFAALRRRHHVPRGYAVHGHAIVSADDRINDAAGRTPPALRNKADWARFQTALDTAAITVLGRLGHEAHPLPEPIRRRRLVVTRSVIDLEHFGLAWLWNPAGAPLAAALEVAAPEGGILAVVGGQAVFDLFLAIGYDEFHLARAEAVILGEGATLFSYAGADETLRASGMAPGGRALLDPEGPVSLTVWRTRSADGNS